MRAIQLTALRWLRDRVDAVAMNLAWQVERIERSERDGDHTRKWGDAQPGSEGAVRS